MSRSHLKMFTGFCARYNAAFIDDFTCPTQGAIGRDWHIDLRLMMQAIVARSPMSKRVHDGLTQFVVSVCERHGSILPAKHIIGMGVYPHVAIALHRLAMRKGWPMPYEVPGYCERRRWTCARLRQAWILACVVG
jgi:hypothetical protein